MRQYKLSLIKNYRGVGDDHKDNYLKRGNTFVGITWFKTTDFNSMSESGKKKFIRQILKRKNRTDLTRKYQIKPKEKVIVNRQGYYGLDEALFKGKIKMPKHLVDGRGKK